MGNLSLTCSFKLHNPSGRRQEILDHVFTYYTLALKDVFGQMKPLIPELKSKGKIVTKDGEILDKYSNISVGPFLPKSGYLDYPIASSLKDALLKDAASNIASHLALYETDQDPGYPEARDPSPAGYPNALEDFALVGLKDYPLGEALTLDQVILDDENSSKKRLLRRTKVSVMPISFSRTRDFKLLYDWKNNRFFFWGKLLPKNHELCRPVVDQGNLIDLHTGEVFSSNSKIAILFPIALGIRNGDWHWQYNKFIQPLIDGEISIQTAKLIKKENKKGNEYFLNVSFKFDAPIPYTPKSYLGVDRGVFFSMAYAIVDKDGAILEMNHSDDGFRHERIAAGKRVQKKQARGKAVTVKDYRQKHLDAILHSVINDITDRALHYQSMIVLEDLDIQIKGKFYKSAWVKMHKFLEYKCKILGIPIWKGGIWAAYSSQICIICGELNKGRKRDRSAFICPVCGATYHSDEGAGVNIARRAMYKKVQWEKKGGYRAFHRSFNESK